MASRCSRSTFFLSLSNFPLPLSIDYVSPPSSLSINYLTHASSGYQLSHSRFISLSTIILLLPHSINYPSPSSSRCQLYLSLFLSVSTISLHRHLRVNPPFFSPYQLAISLLLPLSLSSPFHSLSRPSPHTPHPSLFFFNTLKSRVE